MPGWHLVLLPGEGISLGRVFKKFFLSKTIVCGQILCYNEGY